MKVKAGKKHEPLNAKSLGELAALSTDAKRARFIAEHPRLLDDGVVRQLNEVVRARLRENAREALNLGETSVAIARRLRSQEALGRSLRSKANALYMLGENEEALKFHDEALCIFREIGNHQEEARPLIPSIQPFILLGKYDQAFAAAEDAKKIFRELGDDKRWAHVEINVGNIYHRQDRFEEGLACYERAYEMLLPFRDAEGLAVALYNMAVCLITLNDFPRVLATYQRAREMCVKHGMTLLVTQSDYNIAYLYYLRGEYSRAIEMLRATREECEKNGDAHVLALCYLDVSEIYLELNLSVEAKEAAHEGFLRFQKLGMGYEEASCLAFEAMATSQLGKVLGALELFGKARAKFVSEKNLVWTWLMDLYQAVVLYDEGRLFEAKRLCAGAAEFFDKSFLPSKAVLCHLLMARLALRGGDLAAAKVESARAIERLARLEAPVLHYQAHFLMGQIQQAAGDLGEAYESCQKARGSLETLRSSLRGEELKISFMKNRLEVYESLVELCLMRDEGPRGAEESFSYIEMAKSRSLAEILMRTGPAMKSLEAIRDSLPADAALVEYFSLKDQFVAAVVTRDGLKIVPLTPVSRVVKLLRMLHFQMSKFKLGAEYTQTFEKSMLGVVQAHLRALHEEIFAPVRAQLNARHLIIVPHGMLHYLPFHALLDDSGYLIDSFTISYAPSASVFVHCQEKVMHAAGGSLVMGIPDARAPLILDEVRAVAKIVPDAELLLGGQANQTALRGKGARSRLIHIATHGKFRQDNPMFSGIRLGDAYLNLYDLYQLKFDAELVTLSGCATGMNVVTSGDELLGLIRGLLYAGAHSLLLTLWDVHDQSAADLMAGFYRRFQSGEEKAAALRGAMIELRERYPHPYHWAPFTLIGKVSPK